jgi:hypothetical protein
LKELNKDHKLRDEIIFSKYQNFSDYQGGCKNFIITLEQLEELVENNFIDLDSYQNYSPTAKQILNFMRKYPEYKALGYAISVEREDYRVTLEGVEKMSGAESLTEMQDFVNLFRSADDFIVSDDQMFAWFD